MNRIGLDKNEARKVSIALNELLANYQIFYINTRGFHWNIKGEKFFELHAKFEELYNDLFMKIDEIAERILTLGGTPEHSFSKYLGQSQIKEATHVSAAKDTVENILHSFETVITKQRFLLKISEEAEDEGTNALMSDYIREQEKMVWMYSAYLNQ